MIDWSIITSIFAFGFSSASIFLSIRDYLFRKKVYLLRPHSDRLSEIYAKWILSNDFYGRILDTTFNDLDHKIEGLEKDLSDLKQEPKPIGLPIYAIKHLETGYLDLYERILKFRSDVNSHNKEVLKYILSLCKRLQSELKLPDWHGKNLAYYSRIIVFVSKKILFNEPGGDPYVAKKEDMYFVKWDGADLVRSDSEAVCEKGLELIRKLIENEQNKIKEIRNNAEKLRNEGQQLREEARMKLIEYIRLGALVKGECDVCQEM